MNPLAPRGSVVPKVTRIVRRGVLHYRSTMPCLTRAFGLISAVPLAKHRARKGIRPFSRPWDTAGTSETFEDTGHRWNLGHRRGPRSAGSPGTSEVPAAGISEIFGSLHRKILRHFRVPRTAGTPDTIEVLAGLSCDRGALEAPDMIEAKIAEFADPVS